MAREHYTSRGVRSGERHEGRAVGQHSLTCACSFPVVFFTTG